MKAVVGNTIVAEAPEQDLIKIEGNWYFPPASVNENLVSASPTPYTCPWKGECEYLNVTVDGEQLTDTAWRYPEPYASGIERVGKDFSNYVAFWKGVSVVA
jgi:uncharacterized protein (DUF427 family)